MEIQLAVAKIAKYAMSESGDTVEVIERPHGGVSVVLVDGQRSGRSAKYQQCRGPQSHLPFG